MNKRFKKFQQNPQIVNCPVIDYEEYSNYAHQLHSVIKENTAKNIAITGPFGAGKSSFIKTYKHIYKIDNSNSIMISLPKFDDNIKSSSEEKTEDNKNREKGISNAVFGILHQIFYSVQGNKLPDSRIKRIINSTISRSIIVLISCSLLSSLLLLFFVHFFFQDETVIFPQLRNWKSEISAISSIVVFISLNLLCFIIMALFNQITDKVLI